MIPLLQLSSGAQTLGIGSTVVLWRLKLRVGEHAGADNSAQQNRCRPDQQRSNSEGRGLLFLLRQSAAFRPWRPTRC